jgi:hypothetical protein
VTEGDSLLERFNRYRFDYPSLMFDAFRTFVSDEYRPKARLAVVPLFLLMLCPPAATLAVGLNPFGNVYVFAAVLIVWPWVLEKPAWSLRQWRATPVGRFDGKESHRFDWFIHGFFCLSAICCVVLVAFAGSEIQDLGSWGPQLLALIWAVALAGSTDLARSLFALFLARMEGFPLYGESSRFAPPTDLGILLEDHAGL